MNKNKHTVPARRRSRRAGETTASQLCSSSIYIHSYMRLIRIEYTSKKWKKRTNENNENKPKKHQ